MHFLGLWQFLPLNMRWSCVVIVGERACQRECFRRLAENMIRNVHSLVSYQLLEKTGLSGDEETRRISKRKAALRGIEMLYLNVIMFRSQKMAVAVDIPALNFPPGLCIDLT